LDEALATYFEGCVYSRATKKITIGYLPSDRLSHAQELLKKADSPSPEALFVGLGYDRFEAEHYALSWSFVYYLIHRDKGRHKKLFARFLNKMNGSGVKPVSKVFKIATKQTLTEVQKAWPAFIGELKARPIPRWMYLSVAQASPTENLKAGDRVWSLNGHEIVGSEQFSKLWKERSKETPSEIIVVREKPLPKPMGFDTEFVRVSVLPGSKIKLGVDQTSARAYSLVD